MVHPQKRQVINEFFIYIAVGFALTVFLVGSFPQLNVEVTQNQILLFIIVLVLLLFRYFSKIEITGLLKLSRDVEKVKEEIKETRSSIQSLALSMASSRATAVVNLGGFMNSAAEEAREVDEDLVSPPSPATIPDQLRFNTEKILEFVDGRQFVAAFAMLRNGIETELREIFRARGEDMTGQRGTVFHLARRAKKSQYIESDVFDAILVVNNTANAILHSAPYEQVIPFEKARYISQLGIKTLYQLRRIRGQES